MYWQIHKIFCFDSIQLFIANIFYYLFIWFLLHDKIVFIDILHIAFGLNLTWLFFVKEVEQTLKMIFFPESTGKETAGNFTYFRVFSTPNQMFVVVVFHFWRKRCDAFGDSHVWIYVQCFTVRYKISWFWYCFLNDANDPIKPLCVQFFDQRTGIFS